MSRSYTFRSRGFAALGFGPDRTASDEILIAAYQNGRDKMLKHYKKFNWIYCVALILDPRIKSVGLSMSSWGQEIKEEALMKFKSMYEEYLEKLTDQTVPKQPCRKNERLTKKVISILRFAT